MEKDKKIQTDCSAAEPTVDVDAPAATYSDSDRCVICGQYVPEGTMICHQCFVRIMNDNGNNLLQI